MTAKFNPYSVPDSALTETVVNQRREVAGKWRRFGTWLIDYICFLLLSMLFGVVVGLLFGSAGLEALKKIPNIVLGLILLLGYYCFFEGIWARTPGKLVLGTIVVSQGGDKPSFGQIVGRTLCRFIPFEAFSFFGEEGEGWHDSIPKTQVVLVPKG
ncbi:hypothetical protein GCM10008098_08900 [Rhodanobacter panaciterrae]|uniref:RDD domain-containing protein n=1 Tax=Rhodanobacter panaciterrae TaxID=490572 RepID=A0ABQ2ZL51_9GAMM|nr:RDD family protein [Rhodanobacter panaciterrae]GGY18966.1 hypothetical protein GCM10008098_08900 [Rhodanobacter panaciterrae]